MIPYQDKLISCLISINLTCFKITRNLTEVDKTNSFIITMIL